MSSLSNAEPRNVIRSAPARAVPAVPKVVQFLQIPCDVGGKTLPPATSIDEELLEICWAPPKVVPLHRDVIDDPRVLLSKGNRKDVGRQSVQPFLAQRQQAPRRLRLAMRGPILRSGGFMDRHDGSIMRIPKLRSIETKPSDPRRQPNIMMPAAAANIMIPTNANTTSDFEMLSCSRVMKRGKRKPIQSVQADGTRRQRAIGPRIHTGSATTFGGSGESVLRASGNDSISVSSARAIDNAAISRTPKVPPPTNAHNTHHDETAMSPPLRWRLRPAIAPLVCG